MIYIYIYEHDLVMKSLTSLYDPTKEVTRIGRVTKRLQRAPSHPTPHAHVGLYANSALWLKTGFNAPSLSLNPHPR